ncbi:response regulator [Coleofasciculus sp. LEGE 07092]|nr:hybrid sensor histidine kinase/response regulator [Coleofasciculus sp. LEGE 07081]MBE9129353.1 response regulator [Coleofasciculus sp. LEGE 07081]MBE9151983.1 response regulator [Coleofasciculus sp. LEGE 07092]
MKNIFSKTSSSKVIQILLVEDEKIIALNLKESLESLGYAVPAIATSGEKAIQKATQLRPDLVLMDIRLKGKLDGIQAAQEIWERLQIPVIYVTGHSDQGTLARAKITAPFGYILKPVNEQGLSVAIEIALQRYEREQLLTAILRGMGDGAIVIDTQKRIQFLNSVAESLTGWQLSEARDRPLTEVFQLVDEQTQQPLENFVTPALQEGIIVYLEDPILLVSKNGTTIPIADSIAPIRDNKGVISGAVVLFRDITQRRMAEERNLALERARHLELQMAELQRLDQLKDDFLSTVSHELRTPLSNIKIAVRLLETVLDQKGLLGSETRSDSGAMVRYLTILRDQCNQELKLVNDLLDMRSLEAETYPLELTAIDLQTLIPHIVDNFHDRAQAKQQTFQVRLPPDLPPLVSDKSSLSRIVSELLNNACKYTPTGEQIEITAHSLPREAFSLGDAEPSSTLGGIHITVSNSGVEIPPAELARIFDPFYRVPNNNPWKQGGTGLGLALARKLVTTLQGTLEVTSDCGWTRFAIAIPTLEGLVQEVDNDDT